MLYAATLTRIHAAVWSASKGDGTAHQWWDAQAGDAQEVHGESWVWAWGL